MESPSLRGTVRHWGGMACSLTHEAQAYHGSDHPSDAEDTELMLLTRAEPEVQARWLHLLEEMPMGEVRVPVRLTNPYEPARFWEGTFLVDSGATNSHVPMTTMESLGIRPTGTRDVWLADNRRIRRLVSFAGFTVLDQTDYATVFFVEDDVEPILGLTVLESLGLLIDPARERLLPPSVVSD